MRHSNGMPPEDTPCRYVVRESGQYELDREAAFLRRLSHDPDFAGRWLKRLGEVIADLTGFPGPLSHAVDEAATRLFGREVRRLLYYGPTRRTGIPTRILFTLLPPNLGEPPETDETTILLLRLLHGAQSPLFDNNLEE